MPDLESEDSYDYNSEPDLYDLPPVRLGDDVLAMMARIYVNRTDVLSQYLDKVEPIEGFEDVGCHGHENGIVYNSLDGYENSYTAAEFAEILKNDRQYHGGDIRLLSCSTGALADGFAQQLANILNVKVLAPTETLYVDSEGRYLITNSEVLYDMWKTDKTVNSTGEWRLFTPKEKEENRK